MRRGVGPCSVRYGTLSALRDGGRVALPAHACTRRLPDAPSAILANSDRLPAMQERVPDAQGVHPLGTRALSAAIGSSQPPPDWPTEKGYLDEQLTLLMLRSTRNSARGEEGGASGYNSHPEDKIESNHSPGPPLHGSRVPAQRPCAPSQLSTVPGEVPRNPAVTAAPANSDAEVPQTRGRPGKRKAAPSPRESKSAGTGLARAAGGTSPRVAGPLGCVDVSERLSRCCKCRCARRRSAEAGQALERGPGRPRASHAGRAGRGRQRSGPW